MDTYVSPQKTLSPQTVQQQQSRMGGIVFLCVVLGPIAVILGGIIGATLNLKEHSKRLMWLLLVGLVGAGTLYLRWPIVQETAITLAETAKPLVGLIRPGTQTQQNINWLKLFNELWPLVLRIWIEALALTPLVTMYLFSSRVRTAEEMEIDRHSGIELRRRTAARTAAQVSKKAPDAVKKDMVIGLPVRGDLSWEKGGYFTYPADILGRHAILIGGSGTGKTETSLRIAYGAAKVYGWKVFYLDCKGDKAIASRFSEAMLAAGKTAQAIYPQKKYHGWRGDATAILNRLLAVLDFTEPYYRDMAKMMISLAVEAPGGPPRSSEEFLERLNLRKLEEIYAGKPEEHELAGIRKQDAAGAYNRFRSFFRALDGGLDGEWAFEDVDAAYILLDGLALKDQTASIGRYLLEDFSHYVSKRKAANEKILLIVDEFSAIAVGGTDAANLFERVRSYGAGVIVTSQSYAGLGDGADRILGAAASLILHQCPDPEKVLTRAGQAVTYDRRIGYAERGMGTHVKSYATGQGMLGASKESKIDPNLVKQLPLGGCFIVVSGRSQQVQVSQLLLKEIPKKDEKAASDEQKGSTPSTITTPDTTKSGLIIREAERPARRQQVGTYTAQPSPETPVSSEEGEASNEPVPKQQQTQPQGTLRTEDIQEL